MSDQLHTDRRMGLRSERLLLENGRPITKLRVANALTRIATDAGIGHVTPHQLRHTLATQAINRGMSIESICESCTFFVITIEFKPTQRRQRDDAADKGQLGRQKIFDGLLDRLAEEAS